MSEVLVCWSPGRGGLEPRLLGLVSSTDFLLALPAKKFPSLSLYTLLMGIAHPIHSVSFVRPISGLLPAGEQTAHWTSGLPLYEHLLGRLLASWISW